MAEAFPIWILIPVIVIVGAVMMFKFFGVGKKDDDKGPKERPFEKTCVEHHKRDVKENGIYIKGKLILGHYPIGKVYKYLEKQGKFSTIKYDAKNKKGMIVAGNPEDQDFHIYLMQVHPNSFIMKVLNQILGFWWRFYIIDDSAISFYDPVGKIWQLNTGTNMYHYGGCWITGDKPMELQDGISIMASKEGMMTHMENFAGRIIWLEAMTARKGTILAKEVEVKKAGWENTKRMDESGVTSI